MIKIKDDGRGIDIEKIVDNASKIKFGSKSQLKSLSDEEKMNFIFVDGLSSVSETTEISGCGVGTSSVKSAVEKCGGTINISSKRGEGTEFEIRIPKPEELISNNPNNQKKSA